MNILVTGTPGSGKTRLVEYAGNLRDKRFVDADEMIGLCEWREFKTGKILGLVTDHKETGEDEWYAKYGWYWRLSFLKQYLALNPDSIICGSSENMDETYVLFDKIFFLKKTEQELLSNLNNPTRNNPFGKTPEQRKNFLKWQDYIIEKANGFNYVVIEGNEIKDAYDTIISRL